MTKAITGEANLSVMATSSRVTLIQTGSGEANSYFNLNLNSFALISISIAES